MENNAGRTQLEEVLKSVAGEPLVVLLSGHPDPDAIGSALAHKRICENLGVPATIAHVWPVSHRENRALVKLLGIQMLALSSSTELAKFKYFSLVDTCFPEPSLELPPALKLLTVVDHHHGGAKPEAPFVDVRQAYGTSSTIYAEYLQQGAAPLNSASRLDAQVATALLFGIQTDTDDFSLATPADFAASAYLRPFCDNEVLKQVGRQTVSATTMNIVGRALAGLVVVRDFAVAGVGAVPVADRDAIGSAADYIVRREDIDTVLLYGLVGAHIDGSLRTISPSMDPVVFMKTAFGTDVTGRPYGGGRADKGGFQIPLGIFADCPDPELLWEVVSSTIQARLERVVPDLAEARSSSAGETRPKIR